MRVSVVIPCYDAEAWVGQTIRTLLNQTRPPDEIVVADDGSTDDSRAVVRGFGEVTLIEGPFGGARHARMAGLAASSGEAVMFLDADDLLSPDALEHLVEALEKGDVARCDWDRYVLENEAWHVAPQSCAPRAPWQDDLSAWLTGWYTPPCGILWRRDAVERAGGWATEGSSNDDGDLMTRALLGGARMVRAAGGTAYYRRLPGEASSLSGRRFTAEGIEDRLRINDRVAAGLAAKGRDRRYAFSLHEAYRLVRINAADQPGLRERAIESGRANASRYTARLARSVRMRAGYWARRRQHRDLAPRPLRGAVARAVDGAPLVSVVIPTHDRPVETDRAVASVLAQTHARLEVIVVDDASPRPSYEGCSDPRVTVVRHETNRGVAAARNTGAARASGGLIAYLDSDDAWKPDKLAAQVARLGALPESCGLCVTGYETRVAGRVVGHDVPPHEGFLLPSLLAANVLHGAPSSMLLRRSVHDVIGGFDTALPAAEDWDFVIRAARFFDVAVVPEPLAVLTDDPLPERRSKEVAANIEAWSMLHDRHGRDMRRAGAERAFLMELARRSLSQPGADAGRGRAAVLRALASSPGDPSVYPWLPYMMAPARLRSALRRLDGRAGPRGIA